MSIDFEVAGENWKVAGKLMQTTQPSAPPSLLVALYGRESGGHWRRPFFTTGTFDYIVAVIQALQFVDYKNVLRFYFFNAQLTNYKCSLIQYGDENDSEVLVQNFIENWALVQWTLFTSFFARCSPSPSTISSPMSGK